MGSAHSCGISSRVYFLFSSFHAVYLSIYLGGGWGSSLWHKPFVYIIFSLFFFLLLSVRIHIFLLFAFFILSSTLDGGKDGVSYFHSCFIWCISGRILSAAWRRIYF